MKKAWFFDLDGTLADTDGDIRLAWKAAMAQMGLECANFDRDFVAGPPIEKMAETLFGSAYTPEMGAELRRRFGECYDTGGFPETVEYPGVPAALARLHMSGAYLAIVTNKRYKGATALAAKFGWDKIFDRIYAADMFDADPAIGRLDKTRLLARAIADSGFAKNECVMVGDTAGDIKAADGNGIDSIGVAWGYGRDGELDGAGRVVASAADLVPGALKVSVVIPTYNRGDALAKCVDSALSDPYPSVEVVIADDCSTDGSFEKAKARYAGEGRVKFARTPRNAFTSAARNAGARVATGEILFFLDDDNVLGENCIGEIVACFERHPGAAFVAPATVNTDSGGRSFVWTLGMDFNPWTSQVREWLPKAAWPDGVPPGDDFPTRASPNAFAVSRRAFDEVRGFDQGYGMMFDETDFGMRVTAKCGEGFVCAKASVRHDGYLDPREAGELRALGLSNPRRAYAFGRNRSKFARRHFGFFQALSCAFAAAPLSSVWYGWKALRNGRPGIAWGYLKGTIAGMLGIYPTEFFDGRDTES